MAEKNLTLYFSLLGLLSYRGCPRGRSSFPRGFCPGGLRPWGLLPGGRGWAFVLDPVRLSLKIDLRPWTIEQKG